MSAGSELNQYEKECGCCRIELHFRKIGYAVGKWLKTEPVREGEWIDRCYKIELHQDYPKIGCAIDCCFRTTVGR